MQYYTKLEDYQSLQRSAVTLGKFDGLHRGHQKLVDQVAAYSSEEIRSVVCAFDMGKPALLTKEERMQHLSSQVDCLIACTFTKELREMEAETFIEQILHDKLKAVYVVVGTDFHFGHGKRGDVEMLRQYADQYGYQLDVIEKETYQNREISSTYVKEAMTEGNIQLANTLLGYMYTISGKVEHGKRLGRTLGFPTMNVAVPERKLVPCFGVYACRIRMDGQVYNGIGNIGIKPTVADEPRLLVEVYAFEYEGNAYGKEIEIEFLAFERPEQKFNSVQELKMQVDQDILFGKEYFKKSAV